MFSRRRHLDRRRKYSKEYFQSIIQKLYDANFDNISVVLPHNYESVNPKKSNVDVQDFLSRERNYAAIILVAKSTEKNETMKILFVNSSAKAIFVDDTFPSAVSEPPALYFQSPDPARTYAIFEFFYELLSQKSIIGFIIISIVQLICILFILLEIIGILGKSIFLLSNLLGTPKILDILALILSFIASYSFFSQPSGLWIKEKRELKILSLIKMAIRGEFRDNPIVQLIVTIIGGLIVLFIATIFKLL